MGRKIWYHTALSSLMVLAVVMALPLDSSATNLTDNILTYNLGTMQQVKKNNGYSEVVDMSKDDAHYGWELGQFFVEDFTQITKDSQGNPVFLKTVGDKVELNFTLYQDITQLNGDEKLRVIADEKGYDAYFQTTPTDFGYGTLIIKHTDYQNQSKELIIYTDFLTGATLGANTTVDLLEEGDYEVAFDYKIGQYGLETTDLPFVSDDFQHSLWFVTETDHRISFEFSVRNGNCMVYPYDVETKQELTESSVTENGFYLDLAQSRYLDIQVKKEVLSEGADGLTEDVRFNRPAKDGEVYTDEGIYTITVKNEYTNESTTKKIYVGTNDILRAHVVTGLSVQEINYQVELGAVIEEDGSITAPPPVVEPEVTEPPEETPAPTAVVEASIAEVVSVEDVDSTADTVESSSPGILLVVGAVVVVGTIVVIITIMRKKNETKKE